MKESVEISLTDSMPVKSNKTTLWRNIAFIFGISALLFMVYKIGMDVIWDNVKQTGWWFVGIISVWALVYLINTLAWYVIIREDSAEKVPFRKVFKFTVSGYALNYVTPMGLAGGEPYRIMELKRYMSTEKATANVILYAMMHVCSHFFFWLTGAVLIAWLVPVSVKVSVALTCMVVGCIVLIVLFFRGYKEGLVVKMSRIAGKLPFVGKKIRNMEDTTRDRLMLIDNQIKSLHGKRIRTFYTSLGLEYTARLVNCLEILMIVTALGQEASYVDALIIVALSSLFANILFFSPMQLGTREGGLYLAFKTLGIVPGISISVSFITRIRELFWIMIGILLMKINIRR
ncbi:MAG: lysylphosphatidylglycerol synthase transmembrane domain-containing protein [Bacteroidales bacterium]